MRVCDVIQVLGQPRGSDRRARAAGELVARGELLKTDLDEKGPRSCAVFMANPP